MASAVRDKRIKEALKAFSDLRRKQIDDAMKNTKVEVTRESR